jgi:hypothetical protein
MSTIYTLIGFFSSFTVVPIDPDDVKDQIIGYGVKDEISFIGVDLDARIIVGALHHYTRSPGVYADPIVCADIYYDRAQERRWRRVICVKELMHLLDRSSSMTATQTDCEKLLDDLTGIFEPSASFSLDALHAWHDHLMLYYAVTVLFPFDAREIYYPAYTNGLLSIEKIANDVDLPETLVRLVMSEGWTRIYETIRHW